MIFSNIKKHIVSKYEIIKNISLDMKIKIFFEDGQKNLYEEIIKLFESRPLNKFDYLITVISNKTLIKVKHEFSKMIEVCFL